MNVASLQPSHLEWLYLTTAGASALKSKDRPSEFSHAFTVKTKLLDYIFFMKQREDRDILIHELHNLTEQINVDIDLMSAR